MRWRVFPATWDGQQREGDVVQIVDEDVNGVRVVKAFGQEEPRAGAGGRASAKRLYGSQMRAVRLQSRYQPLLEAIPTLGQVADPRRSAAGWRCSTRSPSGRSSPSRPTSPSWWRRPASWPASSPIGQQARAGVERIFQLLDLPPAIADAPDAVELPALRGEVDLRRRPLRLRRRPARARRASTCTSRRASGSRSSARAAAASRPWPCWSSRFYDPDRGVASGSTGTTCAT